MSVIAIFKYQVQPGRMADFMTKLREAAHPRFTSWDENASPEWRALFEANPDSPETLLSVELLTEMAG